MESKGRRLAAGAREPVQKSFDPCKAAERIEERTEEVLQYVSALEGAPAPAEETLRKRISV